MAGINASLLARNKNVVTFPDESMIGSLMNFINKNEIMSNQKKNRFQPICIRASSRIDSKNKREKIKIQEYQKRSLESLSEFKKIINLSFEIDKILV